MTELFRNYTDVVWTIKLQSTP